MSGLVYQLKTLVTQDTDSETVRNNKAVLMLTVLFKSFGCVGWTVMYYALGFSLAFKFPLVYLMVLISTTYYLYRSKNFDVALYIYTTFILVIPFLLQVVMGGWVNSGAVILWSMLAPTGALFFKGLKMGVIWFVAFLVLCVSATVLEHYIEKPVAINQLTIGLFFLMNVSAVGGFLIYTIMYFKELTTRQNEQLLLNNENLAAQKHIIETHRKEILDSINYARRIQDAMHVPLEEIYQKLPESFVYYQPKDIVAGDFYWFHEHQNCLLIAAADCTGHGVPGALTSMLCSEKLNEAVKHTAMPGEILASANQGIKKSLKQTEGSESNRDGMDIALCSIDPNQRIVLYAGANRPLWIIRKDQHQVEEIKATKHAIGGHTAVEQHFETHHIQLEPGDTIYLFSDGYADQVGGEKGKKLMTKNLKHVLLEIQTMTMNQQNVYLNDQLNRWKGGEEQVDDILMIGVRF